MTQPTLAAVSTAALVLGASLVGDLLLGAANLRSRDPLVRTFAGLCVGLVAGLLLVTLAWGRPWSAPSSLALLMAVGAATAPRRPVEWRDARWSASLGFVVATAAAYSAWLARWFIEPDGPAVLPPFQRDSEHYVILTRFLLETGRESPAPFWFAPESAPYSPYHYFDIWIAVGAERLFGLGPTLSYLAVSQATVALCAVVGLAALVRSVTRAGVAVSMGSAAFALGPGLLPLATALHEFVVDSPLKRALEGIHGYVMSPLSVAKLLPASVVVSAMALALFRARGRRLAPWLAMAGPIVYFPLLPFSLGAMSVLAGVALLRRERRELLNQVVAVGVGGLSLGLGVISGRGSSGGFFLATQTSVSLAEYLGGAGRVLGGAGLRLLVLLGVVVVGGRLLAFGRRWPSRGRWLAAPLLAGMSAATLAWAATHRSLDSWQLLTVVSSCVFATLAASALSWAGQAGLLRIPRDRGRGVVATALAVSMGGLSIGWLQREFDVLSRQTNERVRAGMVSQARGLVAGTGERPGLMVWLRSAEALSDVWSFNFGAAVPPLAFRLFDAPRVVVVPDRQLSFTPDLSGERARKLVTRSPFYAAEGLAPEAEISPALVLDFIVRSDARYVVIERWSDAYAWLSPHLVDCVDEPQTRMRFCRLLAG